MLFCWAGMNSASIKTHLLELDSMFTETVGNVLQGTINDVLILTRADSLDELEPVEKTMIGIAFEKRLLYELGLPTKRERRSMKLDTEINGIPLDIKFSISQSVMIPRECVNQWILMVMAKMQGQTYSVGIIKAKERFLTKGGNRDGKVTISKFGKNHIEWMCEDVPIPQIDWICPTQPMMD